MTMRRRGQAMVEAALTLAVFVAVLMALLDFGQVLFMHQALSQQLAAAARYAAINPNDETAIRNLVVYSTTNPPVGTPAFLGMTPEQVVITRTGAGTSKDRIELRLTGYNYRMFSPGLSGLYGLKPIIATTMVEAAN